MALPFKSQRIDRLTDMAPELLAPDETAGWSLVLNCKELSGERYWATSEYLPEPGEDENTFEIPYEDISLFSNVDFTMNLNYALIDIHWEKIKRLGVAIEESRNRQERYSLDEILTGFASRFTET